MMHFEDEFEFLSNFYYSSFMFEGIEWETAEHAFQAYKVERPEDKEEIRIAPTPGIAKKLGRWIPLRKDWQEIKVSVMERIVYEKFSQNPELRELLLLTENLELVEGNWWHDNFWGVCECDRCRASARHGKNMLGIILMKVREKLKGEAV